MPMRLMMDGEMIVTQNPHMPILPQSNLHLDILMAGTRLSSNAAGSTDGALRALTSTLLQCSTCDAVGLRVRMPKRSGGHVSNAHTPEPGGRLTHHDRAAALDFDEVRVCQPDLALQERARLGCDGHKDRRCLRGGDLGARPTSSKVRLTTRAADSHAQSSLANMSAIRAPTQKQDGDHSRARTLRTSQLDRRGRNLQATRVC
ncbi:hypothetical protein C8T65DRAFT_834884 [Cerioporus squamosus]|nr:hypothetical protein C8T65DRAFT_834884 [Cerioporus squamosus]